MRKNINRIKLTGFVLDIKQATAEKGKTLAVIRLSCGDYDLPVQFKTRNDTLFLDHIQTCVCISVRGSLRPLPDSFGPDKYVIIADRIEILETAMVARRKRNG